MEHKELPQAAYPAWHWQRVRQAIRGSAFSPDWLPSPWNRPAVGYVIALCLPAVMVLFTWYLLQIFPGFGLKGIFALFTTLVVALLWGTGPGLLTTLSGALFLNFVLLPPSFTWSLFAPQPIFETGIFFAFGTTICLVVSRIEYRRNEVERARQQVESLVEQLRHEKEQVAAQANELETIIATIADELFVYSADGSIRRSNPAAEAFNPALLQEEYRAKVFPDRFAASLLRDGEGQPLAYEQIPTLRVLRGETLTGAQTVDTLMRVADGRDVVINVSGAPIRDAEGRIQGAVILTHDVTERRRLERENMMRARQLSSLFEAVPDALMVFDQQGRIVQTNEGARRLLTRYTTLTNASAEQRVAQIQPRMPDDLNLDVAHSPTMRLLDGETLIGANAQDVVVRAFDGEDLWLNVTGAPLFDDAGHVNGAISVVRDLTEQRRITQRTQNALQALLQFAASLVTGEVSGQAEGSAEADEENGVDSVAQRLAVLMSQVLDGQRISLTTFDEQTQQPHSTAIYGLTPEQELAWRERRKGSTIGGLVSGTAIDQRLRAGDAVVLDLSEPPFAGQFNIPDIRNLLLVPMKLQERMIGVVTFLPQEAEHDYTAEELALARALAQLATLTLERARLFHERIQAQATVLALRETNRMMDEFIGIAGHELRTPLTTIKASVQLAKRQVGRLLKLQDRLPPEIATLAPILQGHLERTERQIGMQNRLVSDLLDVTRIHANRLELHPDLCNLVSLVRDSVEDQQYLVRNRTIQLLTDVPDEVLVMADADRVRQVVSNYLSNALKYSESDRPVRVCLDLVGMQVRVSVRDEGPGLSLAQQQRIWERFYRVPEVEVRSGSGVGLGLGLHISRMIVERLGGQVGVESMPGKGSTFWFTLPLAEGNM